MFLVDPNEPEDPRDQGFLKAVQRRAREEPSVSHRHSALHRDEREETSLSCLRRYLVTISIVLLAASGAEAQASYVFNAPRSGAFALVADGRAAPIVVSASDYPGVARVARDLRTDVERVTSVMPTLAMNDLPHASANPPRRNDRTQRVRSIDW